MLRNGRLLQVLQLRAERLDLDLHRGSLLADTFDPSLISFKHTVGIDDLIKMEFVKLLDKFALLCIIL